MWDTFRKRAAFMIYPEADIAISDLIAAKERIKNMLSEANAKIGENTDRMVRLTEELESLREAHETMVGYKQKQINELTTQNIALESHAANKALTFRPIIEKPVCKIHYAAFSVNANKITRPIVVDVKGFIEPRDSLVLDGIKTKVNILPSDTPSQKAWKLMKYIYENYQYVYDHNQFGYNEYWQYPCETLQLGLGDCEDTSILLCTLLRAFGVEAYVHVGLVPQGGHAWVSFVDSVGQNRLLESTWHRSGTETFESVWPVDKDFPLTNDKPEYRTAACFNEQGCWNVDPAVWNLATKEKGELRVTDGLILI
jgi:predicted transglutaminase-like cysteine proteinase